MLSCTSVVNSLLDLQGTSFLLGILPAFGNSIYIGQCLLLQRTIVKKVLMSLIFIIDIVCTWNVALNVMHRDLVSFPDPIPRVSLLHTDIIR